MPTIMLWCGYDEEVVDICHGYVFLASITQFVSYGLQPLSSLLEIEGYARFNAVYDFWECTIGLVLSYLFILLFTPSLFVLGIFHCAVDILSTILFVYLTYHKHEMFDSYIDVSAPEFKEPLLFFDNQTLACIRSLVVEALPFVKDSAVKFIVVSIFNIIYLTV